MISLILLKAKLKAEQNKTMKLWSFHSSEFLCKTFFWDDGFQNIFFHQPTPHALELKKDKVVDYVLSWYPRGVFTSKLEPLYIAFLNSISLFGYK